MISGVNSKLVGGCHLYAMTKQAEMLVKMQRAISEPIQMHSGTTLISPFRRELSVHFVPSKLELSFE